MKKWLLLVFAFLIIGLSLILILNRKEGETTDVYQSFEVYFSTKDAMYLKAETRKLNEDDIYKDAIRHLIMGPESNQLSSTIPDEVELKEIEIRNKVAYIDFNRSLIENHWGGSAGELLTVYSIVNTMTGFKEIEAVKILVEGNNMESLLGHMDLSEPLKRDESIIE
ncbi:MAG: GerMN domain-containing protein [Halanaerobiales bacterium]